MVGNVQPTVAQQPRLLGPRQSVVAGSSGRTTLVDSVEEGEQSGAMSLVHICGGSERGVGEQRTGKSE